MRVLASAAAVREVHRAVPNGHPGDVAGGRGSDSSLIIRERKIGAREASQRRRVGGHEALVRNKDLLHLSEQLWSAGRLRNEVLHPGVD